MGSAEEAAAAKPSGGRFKRWCRDHWATIAIAGGGVLGMVVEDATVKDSKDASVAIIQWYWLFIVPILWLFGARMIRSSDSGGKASFRVQAYHWLGALLAIQLVYILIHQELLDPKQGSLLALVLLALTTFLGGIHLHRAFFLSSFLLAGVAGVAGLLKDYIWVVVAILAGIVVVQLWLLRKA